VVFFAGAVFSELDGELETLPNEFIGEPNTSITFKQSADWGARLGMDLYLAYNFSIGGEVRIFDNSTATFSAAFHF